MAEKIFVGRCVPGKYPDQVDGGFTQEHLDLLSQHINEKGWVNWRMNKGRESGKPYMEIVQYEPKADGSFPKTSKITQGATRSEEKRHYSGPPSPAPGTPTDDLPF